MKTPVGRADLLRLLRVAADAAPEVQAGLAAAAGYGQLSTTVTIDLQLPNAGTGSRPAPAPTPPTGPLRAPLLGAALLPQPSPPPAPRLAQAASLLPLQQADWQGEGRNTRAPQPPSIAPRPRVLPALERAFRRLHPGGLDVPRLAGRLARRELPSRLPRRPEARWAGQRILVLQKDTGLACHLPDTLELARWAQDRYSRVACTPRWLADGADPWCGWHPLYNLGPDAEPQPWAPAPADATVVIVSDLGLADGRDELPPAWAEWLRFMSRQGAALQVWSPLPLQARAPQGLDRQLPVVHWSAAPTSLRPRTLAAGTRHRAPHRLELAQDLLAALAFCPWISRALLRALRHALGDAGRDSGLEQLVWDSRDLNDTPNSRHMLPACLPGHRAAFFQRHDAATRRRLHEAIVAFYRRFSFPLVHLHVLDYWSHEIAAGQPPGPADLQRLEAAQRFAQRLTAEPARSGVNHVEVAIFLHRWLHDGDAVSQHAQGWRIAQVRQAIARLENVPLHEVAIPDGVAHAALAADATAPVRDWWLLLDAPRTQVLLSTAPAGRGQVPLLQQPLRIASADWRPAGGARRWLPLVGDAVALGPVGELHTPQVVVQVAGLQRARGVMGWQQGVRGLQASVRQPGSVQPWLLPGAPQVQPARGAGLALRLHARAQALPGGPFHLGIDPDFGVYADLHVAGEVQRLVWIDPTGPDGFGMGSDLQEREHSIADAQLRRQCEDESPSHRVVLSRGYWLADTPCTQGLWQAVMGGNPSRFQYDPDAALRPVEQVTWDDVQRFLGNLNGLLGEGVQAVLPTEAQWEYACRAGTRTAYAWGDEWSPQRANVNTRGTTPVKQYAPNAWGLYDMHGNVWEWCADGLRDYRSEDEVDPQGPLDGPGRVVRGGSWGIGPARARSAYRAHSPRANRLDDLGFRLALRSPSQVQEGAEPPPAGGRVLDAARPQGAQRYPRRARR